MSKNITGPRALGGFKSETMHTPEGRAGHLEALCAAARRSFETHGKAHLLSWIWVQQTPDGASAPAILAVELVSDLDAEGHDAFEARVIKSCNLGKALAVGTVSGHQSVQVLFESYAGSALHSAALRTGRDPLAPSRPTLDAFRPVLVDRVPERFARSLHGPLSVALSGRGE